MTDRYCLRAYEALTVPRAFAPLGSARECRATPTSPRSGSATRSTWSISSARGSSCAGPAATSFSGLCPFHDERSPSFSVDAAQEALPLLRLRRGRRRVHVRPEARRPRLRRRARVPGRSLQGAAGGRRGGPAGGRAARAPRAAAGAARARGDLLRADAVGVRRGRRRAASTCAAAGSTRRSCASSASATRPARGTGCCWRSRRAGFEDREIYDAGLSQRGQRGQGLRPLPAADHVPAGRPARPRARVRRAGAGRRPAAQVPQHRRDRALPQGPPAVRRRRRAGARGAGRAGDRGRGLHRRHRAAPGRDAQRGGDHGHGDDRPSRSRRWPGWRRRCCWRSTPTAPGRRRCCGPPKVAAGRKLELRVVPLPVGSDPADLVAGRAGRRWPRWSRLRCRSCASRSSARSAGATADARGQGPRDRRAAAGLRRSPAFGHAPGAAQHLVADRLDVAEAWSPSCSARRGVGAGVGRRPSRRRRPGGRTASPRRVAWRADRARLPRAVHRAAGPGPRGARSRDAPSTSPRRCWCARPSTCGCTSPRRPTASPRKTRSSPR